MKITSLSGKIYKTKTRSLKLKQGYDPDKLGQIAVEIDDSVFTRLDTSDTDIREDRIKHAKKRERNKR